MEARHFDEHGVTLVELTDGEVALLVGILNSSDILPELFYTRVPLVESLVAKLDQGGMWDAGRRMLHEAYGLGVMDADTGAIDFKEEQ